MAKFKYTVCNGHQIAFITEDFTKVEKYCEIMFGMPPEIVVENIETFDDSIILKISDLEDWRNSLERAAAWK
jgi:hypothetical protein